MPVCVECSGSIDSLYTEYGKGNICLTQCPKCLKFADKYIEYDYTVIFIDMLLHKPQVYRHLLFNRLAFKSDAEKASRWGRLGRLGSGPLPWGVLKLSLLLIVFEVYIRWAKMEHGLVGKTDSRLEFSLKYLNLLAFSFSEFAIFQLLVRFFLVALLGWERVHPKMDSIIAGLILSSFGKLLHIVMIIWDYHEMEFDFLINLIVFTSNLEAISAVMSISYSRSGPILGLSLILKHGLMQYILSDM